MNPKVEKVEFWLDNGVHVLWSKERHWNITLYKHGCKAITIINTSKRPSVYNSVFYGTNTKFEKYEEI